MSEAVAGDAGATLPGAPGRLGRWVAGARPRTLPAAVVPVLVGTAAVHPRFTTAPLHTSAPLATEAAGGLDWVWRAVCALVVALAIQVGTNYANDYSDGVRGTDAGRVGPVRLVASGLATPSSVKRAALGAFAVAGAAGLLLAAATSWWVLLVGAACLAAGWFYTGGRRPYGYAGLGEAFVFVFFGLVATVGTAYVQTGRVLDPMPWGAGAAVGFLAVALLLANNVRDIDGDRRAHKRTLAVRLGRRRAGWAYAATVAAAFALAAAWAVGSLVWVLADHGVAGRPVPIGPFLPLVALPLAVAPVRTALGPAEGRDLLPVLAATGRLQLVFGLLAAVGLWWWVA